MSIQLISYTIYHSQNSYLGCVLAERAERWSASAFDRDRCPGVPTWVVNGERFWGKDRVELLAERIRSLISSDETTH